MKKLNALGIATAVVGVLIILTPVILPVCEGLLELTNGKQVPMRCFWTARAEMIIGGLIAITGLMIAFLKSAEARRRLNHQVALLGVVTILTPLFIIPTCTHPDMACNLGTKPALIILGAVTLGLGLYGSRTPEPEISDHTIS
ncbi:MAG: DUF4418 family protein [Anaerolineales bacterium]|nr:DUF4418 family protein [Anaerolineales bacterium]